MEQTTEIKSPEQEKIRVELEPGKTIMLYESDRDVGMDEIREYCEVNGWEVPLENSPDYWKTVEWIREPEWDDFISNLKYSKTFPKRVVVVGSEGLWDGRHTIVPTVLPTDDLEKFWGRFAVSGNFEYQVGYDEEGLFVRVVHHDGTNCYHIRELTEEGKEYVEKCEDEYAYPREAGEEPYSRKIDWYIY